MGKHAVDWRKLSKINADQIIRENDVEKLQGYLEMVTFADVDGIQDVDPCVATLLKLSQTMTQYTLATQEQLKQSLLELENENAHLREENAMLQGVQSKNDEYVRKLKLDNRKRRKIIEDLQKRIDLGANAYYSCPYCTKNFINATYLQGHLARKHPDKVAYVGDAIAHAHKIVNDVNTNLEAERKQQEAKHEDIEKRLREEEAQRKSQVERTRQEVEANHLSHQQQLLDTINALKAQITEQNMVAGDKESAYRSELGAMRAQMVALEETLENTRADMHDQHAKMLSQSQNAGQLPTVTPRSPANTTPRMSLSPARTPEREHSPDRQTQQAVTLPAQNVDHVPFEQQRPPLPKTQSPVRQRPAPTAPPLPSNISRQDMVNELERRMNTIGLNLGMAGLSDDEYALRVQMYREQRNKGWGGMGMHELKQGILNELDQRVSMRSRHGSNNSLPAAPHQDSPVRTKSLSQPNLSQMEQNNTGSILKKPSSTGQLGGSNTSQYPPLPPSVPGSNIDMKQKLLENQNYDRVVLNASKSEESVPQAAPRSTYADAVREKEAEPEDNSWGDSAASDAEETEPVSSRAEEPTALTPRIDQVPSKERTPSISSADPDEDDEPSSAAWNESSKATAPAKSVSFSKENVADDFTESAKKTTTLSDDDGSSDDDWMDDLDQALMNQGYNGI